MPLTVRTAILVTGAVPARLVGGRTAGAARREVKGLNVMARSHASDAAQPAIAQRVGRRRLLRLATGGGAVLAGGVGLAGPGPAAAQPIPGLPPIAIRQPQPHDLVDIPVSICGLGTGFEGTIQLRVRDANGNTLAEQHVQAGGTGIWGNFHVLLDLGRRPETAQGTVEGFEYSARDGSEINTVRVPVVFGPALIDPYHGFALHAVVRGETLFAIARNWYGDASYAAALFEANRNQLNDPDELRPGQVLRIPE